MCGRQMSFKFSQLNTAFEETFMFEVVNYCSDTFIEQPSGVMR